MLIESFNTFCKKKNKQINILVTFLFQFLTLTFLFEYFFVLFPLEVVCTISLSVAYTCYNYFNILFIVIMLDNINHYILSKSLSIHSYSFTCSCSWNQTLL